MRIAILSGRNSVHAVRWTNEMARRGHDVHLISVHPGNEPLDPGVTLHMLPYGAPAGYVASGLALRRVLRQLLPDVLHVHHAGGYGVLGQLSGYHPRIVSVWGADVFLVPSTSPVHHWLIVRTLKTADWVCSTSAVMAVRTRVLCPELPHLSVVPFGVEMEKFQPRTGADVRPRRVIVGAVKQLSMLYGVDVLLRAFVKARDVLRRLNSPEAPELELRIIGDGPDRQALVALAQQLGLPESVFYGRAPHAQIPSLLREMDIFVAVKRAESFGVAVIEASATGLPVVVSDVGGLPEVVAADVTGFIVPAEDVAATAAAIITLALNPDLRETMGAAGRRLVEERYTWSRNADTMEEIYREVARIGPGRVHRPMA
ncbi:MAG: glycosyltransferase [Anaerolineales bacterium]|nr:glycosyltransferase [Anaerolineales bacterium]